MNYQEDFYEQQGFGPVKQETEESSFWGDGILSTGMDIAGGAIKGVYDAVDAMSFDLMPDWDEESLWSVDTGIGKMVGGFTQFAVPYAGLGKLITAASSTSFVLSVPKLQKAFNWLDGNAATSAGRVFMDARKHGRGARAFTEAALVGASVKGGLGRAAVKGAAIDFLAFDASQENLSNLVQTIPSLANPINEFLAIDQEDPEVLNRLRNVVEGAALGTLFDGIFDTLRATKAGRKVRAAGGTDMEVRMAQLNALDDSVVARRDLRWQQEDLALQAEAGTTFEINVGDEIVTRTGAELEADADEFVKGISDTILEDPDVNPLATPMPQRGGRKLPDTIKAEAPEDPLGIANPDYEDMADASALADDIVGDAKYGDPNVNPKLLTPEERKARKMGVFDRNFSMLMSEGYAARVTRAIERSSAEVHVTESNAAWLSKAMDEVATAAGLSPTAYQNLLQQGTRDAGLIRSAAQRNVMFRVLQEQLADQLAPYIDQLAKAPSVSVEELSRISTGFAAYEGIAKSVKNVLSELGRGLQSAQIDTSAAAKSLKGVDVFTPLMDIKNMIENPEAFDKDAIKQILEQMSKVMGSDNALDNLKAGMELASKPWRKKTMAVAQEYHIASLLSGFTTQLVNTGSAAFMSFYRPLEAMAGASLGRMLGDKGAGETFQEELQTLINLPGEFREAFGLMKQSGGDIFKSEGFIEGTGFSPMQYIADNSKHPGLWSPIASTVRTPSKVLGYMDNYMKLVNGRAKSRAVLQRKLMLEKGMEPSQVSAMVEAQMKTIMETRGNFRNQGEFAKMMIREGAGQQELEGFAGDAGLGASRMKKLIDYSDKEVDNMIEAHEKGLQAGKDVTFTTKLKTGEGNWLGSIGSGTNRIIQNVPVLKFFLPFIKTPINIAEYGWDRTVGAILGGVAESTRATSSILGFKMPRTEDATLRLSRELASADPGVRSVARAKLTMGIGTVGSIMLAASEEPDTDGMRRFTGSGPSDPDVIASLREAGWQPFSVRINGKYYSYARLDPIATIIGIAIDAGEFIRENAEDAEDASAMFSTISMGLATSMANNITNKSYLKGMGDLIEFAEDPDNNAARIMKSLAGGFVPTLAAGAARIVDPNMREIRDATDAMMARVPGLSKRLPIRRNLLGEPLKYEDAVYEFLVPIRVTRVKDEVVSRELARFSYGFSEASPKRGGIDLMSDDYAMDGQLAYDRYVELSGQVQLRGMTLRQALRKTIRSEAYQRMDPDDGPEGERSPRIGEIQKILRQYRNKAWIELQKERPVISNTVREAIKVNKERKAGRLTL